MGFFLKNYFLADVTETNASSSNFFQNEEKISTLLKDAKKKL